MGLDVVEIVVRTEEVFSIDLPDDECAQVSTVGDLYRLVLRMLSLPYLPSSEIEVDSANGRSGRDRSKIRSLGLALWTPPDAWQTVKGIIEHQLQIERDEIRESANLFAISAVIEQL